MVLNAAAKEAAYRRGLLSQKKRPVAANKRPIAAVSLLFPYGKLRRFDDGIENSAAEHKEVIGETGDKIFLCCNIIAIKGLVKIG